MAATLSKVLCNKVQAEMETLNRATIDATAQCLRGKGSYTYKSEIKIYFNKVSKDKASETLEAFLKTVQLETKLDDSALNCIRVGVMNSEQFDVFRHDIGLCEELRGSCVKLLAIWDGNKENVGIAAAYFKVDHHLGLWKAVFAPILSLRGDILIALEMVCNFNCTAAIAQELSRSLVGSENKSQLAWVPRSILFWFVFAIVLDDLICLPLPSLKSKLCFLPILIFFAKILTAFYFVENVLCMEKKTDQ